MATAAASSARLARLALIEELLPVLLLLVAGDGLDGRRSSVQLLLAGLRRRREGSRVDHRVVVQAHERGRLSLRVVSPSALGSDGDEVLLDRLARRALGQGRQLPVPDVAQTT